MNVPEVWGAMGGSAGLAGHTNPSSDPHVSAPAPSPPQDPTSPHYLGFQMPPSSSTVTVSYPPVSRPSIVSMWGIGGFASPPLPTPPPVVCPNTIASTLGIPQMPSATYFSRAPMGCNIRMAGSTLNGVPIVYKRKPEEEPEEVKPMAKQHISEERMAAHLNSLHLSESYYNHRLGKKCARQSQPAVLDEDDDDDDDSGGDEGLGSEGGEAGARLVLSREVKQAMGAGESPLPASLLEKLRKPSMEVVLWQPPGHPLQHTLPPPPLPSGPAPEPPSAQSSAQSSTSSSPDSGISVSSTPPPPNFLGGSSGLSSSGLSSSSSLLSDVSEELLSLPSTSSGARGGFLPPPPRRPASPLPDPMVDDDFERMEFNNNNNNNGSVLNFMWLEENNNTALIDLNAVEPQLPQPFSDLPDLPDSDDMDL